MTAIGTPDMHLNKMDDGQCIIGKQSWPELLGTEVEVAKEIIEMENPYVRVRLIIKGMYRIEDHHCNRVFLWTSKWHSGTVVEIPTVG